MAQVPRPVESESEKKRSPCLATIGPERDCIKPSTGENGESAESQEE